MTLISILGRSEIFAVSLVFLATCRCLNFQLVSVYKLDGWNLIALHSHKVVFFSLLNEQYHESNIDCLNKFWKVRPLEARNASKQKKIANSA